MEKNKWTTVIVLISIVVTMLFSGCGNNNADPSGNSGGKGEIEGLTFVESVELDYAEGFAIDRYEGGYFFLDIYEDGKYLIVPEGEEAPEGLDDGIRVIHQPLENV